MNKITRNIYRGLLIFSFLAISALTLFAIGSVLAFLQTGADRSSMLHLAVENADVYLPKIEWSNLENPGRPMELPTLKNIEKDYLNAWYIRQLAYTQNDTYGIENFYTDCSRVNLYQNVQLNNRQGVRVEASTLAHNPDLEFYSANGQLVVFTDKNVVEFQTTYKDDTRLFSSKDTSDYQVMMLLEDGHWRVRHMVRMPASTKINPEFADPLVQVKENQILFRDSIFIIKGINYYPQASPWDMFGKKFDPDIIEADFKLIKKTGLNSIRIFIQYEDFGKAEVKPEKLQKLNTVLDLAQKQNLKVIPTLFDFYGDYSVLDWSLTQQHARQIVTPLKSHPAILAWDIKNEPDLDFENRGKENILNWLKEIIQTIKQEDPNHLVTVGWSSAAAAQNLVNRVDFISFHFYQPIDDFNSALKLIEDNANGKPLLVEEFGLSSYWGIWNPFGSNEKQQAEYHKKMQAAFKKDTLAFMSWSLYDYSTIPSSVVGKLPWRKAQQKEFGFLDHLGNPKPSFTFITY